MARTVPLAGDVLDDLPSRCRGCVFWELGADRPPDLPPDRRPDLPTDGVPDERPDAAADDRVRKQAWVTAQSLEEGPPGVLLRRGGRTVAYALFAEARAFAPRPTPLPTVSEDALLLATAWVAEGERGVGHGRALVQAAVREALRRDLRAVEAYGDRRSRAWDCVVPAAWLLHAGFEVEVEHPRYPLLRIDTGRVARWAESLEHAVDELLGRARPQPVPQPGARSSLGD